MSYQDDQYDDDRRRYNRDEQDRSYRGRSRDREQQPQDRGEPKREFRERPASSRDERNEVGDAPRRTQPVVCFGCKAVGHYRSDCWRLWTNPETHRQLEADGYHCPQDYQRRGRSSSPRRNPAMSFKRSPSEEPKTAARTAELEKAVEAMKSFIDAEMARRSAKENKKLEKAEAKQREEQERLAREEVKRLEDLKNL
ncbi:hypothetical protein CBR_g964 [Chara braunii]|uniref:CCHC-type domain-containing protein n=1 Tax=Chara braunii TaxID=69332 RepID=A0A388KD16_CHABU|nr:hypothetical protein CBR_g964 [Chara braunii]|eukprot:GBG67843.1 hypothetical protein CBR_g964 [Chara braunii]